MCVSYTPARTNTCLLYVIMAELSPFSPYPDQQKVSDLHKRQGPTSGTKNHPVPLSPHLQPLVPETLSLAVLETHMSVNLFGPWTRCLVVGWRSRD